jgi:hypothetical protein
MSSRARKRARAAAAGEVSAPTPPDAPPKPLSRSERRNAEARAALEPLEEGERPVAVTVAAVIAGGLVVANIALAVGGYKIQGKHPAVAGVVVFTALLLAMAIGLWRVRYWAVLGMEALLAITMLLFSLALPFASNVRAVVVSVAVLIPAATLFWFLIRAMARIQMPDRR